VTILTPNNNSSLELMQLALQQAEQAAKLGEVPIGAVLRLNNGQLFSDHNRVISKHDSTAHAELNVIRQACNAMRNYRLVGSSLYVSLEPCCMCAGALLHARIEKLYFATHEPKTGAVCSLHRLLDDARQNHQVQWQSGLCGEASRQQLQTFFRQRRQQRKQAKQAQTAMHQAQSPIQ